MARKEKKYHFIYKTTNVLSGRYYIGMHSTSNLDDGYLGSGNRLKLAVRKHGKENFIREILEYCESREELKRLEEEVVNLNEIAKVDCMNLKVGGQGGFVNDKHKRKFIESSNVARDLHIERLKNDKVYYDKFIIQQRNHFKKLTKEGKLTYGNFEGRKHSEETKEKMRKPKNMGSNNSQYGKCWITNEVESKKIMKGDLIPDGWRLGRKC